MEDPAVAPILLRGSGQDGGKTPPAVRVFDCACLTACVRDMPAQGIQVRDKILPGPLCRTA